MLTVAVSLCFVLVPVPPLSEELKSLQGEWQAISVEEKGEAWNKVEAVDFKLDISGDTLIYKRNNPIEKFRMTLDAKQKPAHMDLRLIAGNVDPNKACHAIYSLENGRLKLCLQHEFTADSPDDRPTEFTTGGKRPTSGSLLVVLERKKK